MTSVPMRLPSGDEILAELAKIGYDASTVACVLQAGSSLYLEKNVGDVDLNVITTRPNDVPPMKGFSIGGVEFDQCQHPLDEWNHLIYRSRKYFVDSCPDMRVLYGSTKGMRIWSCVTDERVRKYLIRLYDVMLFNPTPMTEPFPEKRLWSFLLFAFKYANKREGITEAQRETLQRAHDLEIGKEQFRDLFNRMKGEIL